MVVLLEGSPISTEELWSSVRVTIGFLVTSLPKALLPRLLNLAGGPALGIVLVVPNFFHLRMIEATVFLGIFNAEEILSQSSTNNSFDLMARFLLWHALLTGGPSIKQVYAFPNHVQSI